MTPSIAIGCLTHMKYTQEEKRLGLKRKKKRWKEWERYFRFCLQFNKKHLSFKGRDFPPYCYTPNWVSNSALKVVSHLDTYRLTMAVKFALQYPNVINPRAESKQNKKTRNLKRSASYWALAKLQPVAKEEGTRIKETAHLNPSNCVKSQKKTGQGQEGSNSSGKRERMAKEGDERIRHFCAFFRNVPSFLASMDRDFAWKLVTTFRSRLINKHMSYFPMAYINLFLLSL